MRLKLYSQLSTPFIPVRLATTAATAGPDQRQRRDAKPKPAGYRARDRSAGPKPVNARIHINSGDKAFFRPDGTLFTSQANVDFFLENDIDHDNSAAFHLNEPETAALLKTFRIQAAYSPQHIIHPQHVQYFHPEGHPLASKVRVDYARRVKDEPLWIWISMAASAGGIVRSLMQRRLKSSVFTALERMGYGRAGKGPDGVESINGTLFITMYDPLVTANLPVEEFGNGIAKALIKRNNQSGF